MDFKEWVSKNCKFAADNRDVQAPPGTQVPPMATQQHDQEQALQDEMQVPLGQVFSHLAENIEAYKSTIQYSQDQNYPSFQAAYAKTFGNINIQEVENCLDKLGAYLGMLAQNQKFKPFEPKIQRIPATPAAPATTETDIPGDWEEIK